MRQPAQRLYAYTKDCNAFRSLFVKAIVIALVALLPVRSLAQTYTPVVLSGFNADVICNGPTFAGSTTADVDGGNYFFLDQSFTAFGTPIYYLPSSGTINSAATPGLVFQLADASSNNSLRLVAANSSGTLSFASAQSAGIVYVLATSGSGISTVNITVNFADATSQTFTGINIADWYNGTPVVIQGIGRVNGNAQTLDNGGGSSNPRLYQFPLALSGANLLKPITGITVTKTNAAGFAQIMGVTLASSCTAPTAQPTALVLTGVSPSQIDGSFTASVPAADEYLVVRYPAATAPTDPVNGVSYSAGTALGAGTVVYSGPATTFSATGLDPATSYTFYVYAFNNTNCVGPVYNTTSPLTASQSTNTCATLTGVIPVGPTGTYPSLTAALAALSTGISGPVVLELQTTYNSSVETFPLTIGLNPCFSASNTLTIRPAAGATALSITSADPVATIDLNGSKYVTIDGRPGGTGTQSELTIVNTANSGVAIRFINDAHHNTITYCDIQGQNTTTPPNPAGATMAGVVYFGGTNTVAMQGNDDNVLSFCSIHGTPGGNPHYGILATGSTASVGAYNDNNTITNCQIYDFFSAGSATTGIKLDAGNNAWTISDNHFYQTTLRTYTTANTHRVLWITPNTGSISNTASGFIVTGNKIGGNAPNAAGTYELGGNVNTNFMGMDISVGHGTPTSIQGNIITNIDMTSTTQGFVGIHVANGNVEAGTVTGNTVGAASGVGSIKLTVGTTGGATLTGYRVGAGSNITYANNVFGSVTTASTGTTAANIVGFMVQGGTNVSIINNTIGSLGTPNSLNASNSTNSLQSVTGIQVTGGTTTLISGNTIVNLNNNYTGTSTGLTRGIAVTSSATSIVNNTIMELSSTSQSTGTGANAAITGIVMTSTSSGATISGNKIHSLRIASASAGSHVVGLFFSGSTAAHSIISKNQIHSFDIVTANTGITLTGVDYATGGATFSNNIIRLGIKPDGTDLTTEAVVRGISSNSSSALNNFYFNSIYIGGNGVGSTVRNSFAFTRTSTSGTYDIQNNIFVNVRSNATTGGKHYALLFNSNTTGVNADYNVYYANGTGGVFANNGSADVATYASAWISSDVHSFFADPLFVNPTGTAANFDLHLQAGTVAEGVGIDIPSITDDFDGDVRSGLSPTDIGADAGDFGAVGVDVGVNGLIAPTTGVCYGAAETVTVRLKNYSSTQIDFAVNNVTINVSATGPAAYAGNITLNSGTLSAGATMNVTLPATINMTAAGNYVFSASSSATGDANAANNAMADETRTVIAGSTLSGIYNVGAGQGATGGFNTLTDAIAAYNSAACLDGDVIFNLTDATYSTGETFPLVIDGKPGVYTLTIRPGAGVAATIVGTSGTTANALIKLNGADRVIIDGINSGGSSLTIENTSTTNGTAVIWLASLGVNDGAQNNIIRNCTIRAGINQASSTSTTYGIVMAGNTLSTAITSVAAGNDNDNNLIEGNTIMKVRYGIYTRGGSTLNPNMGTVIKNNIVGPASFGADQIGRAGIVVREEDGLIITGNEVRYVGGDYVNNFSGSDRVGIALTTDAIWPSPTTVYIKNAQITNNIIHHIVEEKTFSGAAIVVAGADGLNPTNNIIANNFIYSVLVNGTSGDHGVGIGVNAGNGDKIVFNSIYMTGDVDPHASATSPATSGYGLNIGSTSVLNPTISNNIIFMDITSSSNGGLRFAAINVPTGYNWGSGGANYNDLYVDAANSQAYVGATGATNFYQDLAGWQGATGQDMNSLSVEPPFISPTNLHIDIALGYTLDNMGTPIAGVTTDIDGDLRNASTPDIGADEFTIVTGIDFGARTLVSPGVKACYGPAETVTVRIRNYSANIHDFAAIPVTVHASVAGPNPVTFAPVIVNTGTIAPGDSLEVVITNSYDMSALGTYTFDAFTTVAADGTPGNNAMVSVNRTLSAVVAGTVTSTSGPFCLVGTPILSLSGSNGNIQWQESTNAAGPWTNVGTNSNSYIPGSPINTTTYYQAVVSCNASSVTTNTIQIVVNTPEVTTSAGATRCGPGVVTLTATGSAGTTLNWYTAATGGTPIGTGASFQTPIINTTTTFYVAAEVTAPFCASARTAVVATVNVGPSLDITNNLTVCNDAITTLQVNSTLSDFNDYQWSPATGLFTDAAATVPYTAGSSATTLYAKLSAAGTHTYVVTGNNTTTTCQNYDSVKLTVLPASITINPSPEELCVSGNTTLTISPDPATFGAATYQWQSSPDNTTYTNIAGATSASYSTPVLTTTTYYQVEIKNSAGAACLTEHDTVKVNNPQILATTPASICGPGSATLTATASSGATINWYSDATGGTLLGTGGSFNTPNINTTTTYYVAAEEGGASYTTGVTLSQLQFGLCGAPVATASTNWPLRFTTTKPVVINSAYIIPQAAGNVTVELHAYPSTGPIATQTYTFGAGDVGNPTLINMGFSLPSAGNYQLVITAGGTTRITTLGCGYPMSTPGGGMILTGSASSLAGVPNTTTYNSFYHINVTEACESSRTPVTAEVNTVTAITTQPQSQAVCAGADVTFSVTADGTNLTYQWMKGTTPIAGATNPTLVLNNVQVSDAGTYSVEITGVCGTVTSATVNLAVSATNSWLGAVSADWNDPANWCGPVPDGNTDVAIPAGTPYSPVINSPASVRNITINAGASVTLTPAARFNIHGNYSNAGTMNAASGFIYFKGAVNQNVDALTAANIVVDGAGISLNGDMNATTLILQNGNITLGANDLTTSGSVNGTVTSHIITNGTGSVISTNIGAGPVIIPVGPDAANYNPVMIANGQGSDYTVRVVTGITPAIQDASRAVNRTWSITSANAVGSDVSVTMQFANAHGNANFNTTAAVEVGLNQGGIWMIASPPNGLIPLGGATERQVTVHTQSFGSFVISSPGGLNIPVGIPSVNSDITKMTLMPNPVEHDAVLRVISVRAVRMQWRVTDVSGRIIMSFNSQLATGMNDIRLSCSSLAAGTYYLTGVGERGKTQTIQFIKL